VFDECDLAEHAAMSIVKKKRQAEGVTLLYQNNRRQL